MRKEIITKILLILMVIGFSLEAYADTQADLVFKTSVPRATSIKKLLRGAAPISVNPENGALTGGTLAAEFELDSNVTDESQKFVMTATINTQSGIVPAYDSSGNLLFANTTILPSSTDVSEALSHSGNNCNVVVYPITVTTTSPIEHEFTTGHATYGNCYIIDINGAETGTVTQTVNSSPVANTYSNTRDTAGTYRATITLTAIPD